MTDDLQQRLADSMRQRAGALEVSPAPVDTIIRKSRSRLGAVAVIGMVAAAALVTTGVVVWSGSESEPQQVAQPGDWQPRGSLGYDDAMTKAIRDHTRLANASGTRTVLWYAADGPAGRIVAGATSVGDQSEVVVLAGPSGSGVTDLRPVGIAGERADDGVVSRVITDQAGKLWLWVLGGPDVDGMQISAHPVYDQNGVAARAWQPLASSAGVSLTEVRDVPVAARVRLSSHGSATADKPVFEDSDNLNDPGFFPVTNAPPQPLAGGTDLRGADEDTVQWLASQLSVATGVAVSEMVVAVRWARGKAALTTVFLPSGGTLAVYGDLTSGEYIDVVPLSAAEADRFIFARPVADGVEVIAPHIPGATVRIGQTEVRLDDTGHGTVAVQPDPGKAVTVEAGTAGIADLGAENRTDPFDLR
jgi:hypothetical protein